MIEYKLSSIENIPMTTEIDTYSLGNETLSFNHEITWSATGNVPHIIVEGESNLKNCSVEFNTPIMIQARWHKKHRINKKWLKRYGMKEDYILVRAKVVDATFDTERENPYEMEYRMTLDGLDYKFRPDQLRKNLKMEVCY